MRQSNLPCKTVSNIVDLWVVICRPYLHHTSVFSFRSLVQPFRTSAWYFRTLARYFSIYNLKVHTDRTRFGNATRILDFGLSFYFRLFLILCKFLNTFQQSKLVGLNILQNFFLCSALLT